MRSVSDRRTIACKEKGRTCGLTAMDTLTQSIARFACGFAATAVPAASLALARYAFTDLLGVMLAGGAQPVARILTQATAASAHQGRCTVLLDPDVRRSAADAALVNGTAAHALDFDDVQFNAHPSTVLVPAILAEAERGGKSGLDMEMAYVLGYEVWGELHSRESHPYHDKGWHPTATLGVFGAAAAAGHLLGLSAKKQAIALAIAASFASGIKANFGTMVKPLHVGQSARNGLLAALMADAGYDANPEALEHHQGFFNAFNGKGNYDAKLIFENWANPLEVLSPSMGLKQFACCGSTHPAVTMALQLRQEETFSPQDIEKVDILPHRRRLPHTNNPDPQTPLAAKFSVQYAVARALVNGAVRLDDFEGEAHFDSNVREIMAKTTAMPHPDMPDDSPDQFGAEVIVALKDGRTVARRINSLVGRGGDYPLTSDELWEKFNDCAKRVLPANEIPALFAKLESLEKIKNIRDLTPSLAKFAKAA